MRHPSDALSEERPGSRTRPGSTEQRATPGTYRAHRHTRTRAKTMHDIRESPRIQLRAYAMIFILAAAKRIRAREAQTDLETARHAASKSIDALRQTEEQS